jgi:hypothetical protein
MATSSVQQTCLECPPRVRAILRAWHADRSISEASAGQYLRRIRRFRRYCVQLGLREVDELTYEGAKRFKAWCAKSRGSESGDLGNTSSSLRALRRVYEVMGTASAVEAEQAPCTSRLDRLARLCHAPRSAPGQPRGHRPQEARPHRQAARTLGCLGQVMAPNAPAGHRRVPHPVRLQLSMPCGTLRPRETSSRYLQPG